MASVNAVADTFSVVNYVGTLYQKNRISTPFLSMIGFNSNGGRIVNSLNFDLRQNYSLDAGSQPAITETASLSAATTTSYARSQTSNTCQIFKENVAVSYLKQSATGQISGLGIIGNQPVASELDFQIMAHLDQMAVDIEYSFVQGTYQLAANAGTAAKTRGILEACVSNSVNAGGADLTKSLIDSLLIEMQTNGARFGGNMVIFASGSQVVKISEAYGKAPDSRNVGGINITMLQTNFGDIGIVNMRQMPSNTILVADIDAIAPAYLPVPGKGFLFYEDKQLAGSGMGGELYAQVGLDYGAEEFHGVITNLAV
jgi:uncharacterized protein affecting Mg2+/Co2+ transport